MKIYAAKEYSSKTHTQVSFAEDVASFLKHCDSSRELHIGIGKRKEVTKKQFFALIRLIIVESTKHKIKKIAIDEKEFRFSKVRLTPREMIELVATQMVKAGYSYDRFKTEKKDAITKVTEVVIVSGKPTVLNKGIERGIILGDQANEARDLSNTPGGEMTPTVLARAAEKSVEGTKVKVSILGVQEMKKLKMGALLGVAKGSEEVPKFIIMEYKGAKSKSRPIILVGKGVTFDSGGMNLKPSSGLDEMHMDMSGAAIVMHTIVAAAQLKIKKHIVALIPAVENMVSGSSYRPGDILKSMSGKTIEVGNTDAEGRVIMADALTYAEKYKPKLVVDVATLTGASLVALGQRACALFTNKDQLVPKIMDIAEATGEYMWQLPLWDEYDLDYKPTFGDISNSGKYRYGGAITAARFLYHFAEKYPWIHIDMAPRMTSIDGDNLAKGSSGEPLLLLVKLCERM